MTGKMEMQHKKLTAAFFALLVACSYWQAEAVELDLAAGSFQIEAKTSETEGQISNIGAYTMRFRFPVIQNFDFAIGYSLIMSNGIGGDLAYGLDLGIVYFPLSHSSTERVQSETAQMLIAELWRPYVSVGFNQRQYQSVQAGYAGFSMSVGTVRQLEWPVNAVGEIRYVSLAGPGNNTATETEVLFGINISF
jgi:hypothetical protein